MISREELLKTNEYWFETVQNEIYRIVSEYVEKEGNSQSKLAEKLGVSKGYISQIMNGNFNYTLKKMIELSLAVDKAPELLFKDINQCITEDNQKRFEMQYQAYFNMSLQTSKTLNIKSGNTGNSIYTETSRNNSEYSIAS